MGGREKPWAKMAAFYSPLSGPQAAQPVPSPGTGDYIEVINLLDYGFRSKCCRAPIRMGDKKIKKTGQSMKVWICCHCKKKDVDILSKEELLLGRAPLPWEEKEVDIDESEL